MTKTPRYVKLLLPTTPLEQLGLIHFCHSSILLGVLLNTWYLANNFVYRFSCLFISVIDICRIIIYKRGCGTIE